MVDVQYNYTVVSDWGGGYYMLKKKAAIELNLSEQTSTLNQKTLWNVHSCKWTNE